MDTWTETIYSFSSFTSLSFKFHTILYYTMTVHQLRLKGDSSPLITRLQPSVQGWWGKCHGNRSQGD